MNIPLRRRLKLIAKNWQRECSPIWQKYGSWKQSFVIRQQMGINFCEWLSRLTKELYPINDKYIEILKELGIAAHPENIQSFLDQPRYRKIKGRKLSRLINAAKKQGKLLKFHSFLMCFIKGKDLREVEFV